MANWATKRLDQVFRYELLSLSRAGTFFVHGMLLSLHPQLIIVLGPACQQSG